MASMAENCKKILLPAYNRLKLFLSSSSWSLKGFQLTNVEHVSRPKKQLQFDNLIPFEWNCFHMPSLIAQLTNFKTLYIIGA